MTESRWHLWSWEPIHRHEGELYLERLRVVSCPWFGLYIHWFHASDDDSLHDHPWPFLTAIVRGGYWEYTPGVDETMVKQWHPPWSIRARPARWLHRVEIEAHRKPVTIVLRGRRSRAWGFKTPSGWIPWPKYKDQKARAAASDSSRAEAR